MYNGSLLERLATQNKFTSYNGLNYDEAYLLSIANNLSLLFSTNAGNSQSAIDYGKPSLENSNLNTSDSVKIIIKKAQKAIAKYEPRLFNTKVYIDKEKMKQNEMHLSIMGEIKIKNKKLNVNLTADLLKNGTVKVNKNGI